MHYNSIKTIVMLVILVLVATVADAQVNDTTSKQDAIIRVDGNIIYGKVVEVDQQEVKYRINDMANGAVITLPRKLVYAISYSNSTTQIITPTFGKRKINLIAFDQKISDNDTEDGEPITDMKYNLTHGSLKMGLGFLRDYSSFKNVKDFNKTASAPSLYAAYQFRFNRFLVTGVNVGYASFNTIMC